jgi:hypothetical protein
LLLSPLATPLHPQPPPQGHKFALELLAADGKQPSYVLIEHAPAAGQTNSFFTSSLVPRAAEGSEVLTANAPSALGLEFKEEGDSASIVASLYFGALTQQSVDLSKHPSKRIGTYSLRLGESVVLQEMRPFGVQPYTITLITGQIPRSNTQAQSKVPALQLTIVGEDRTKFKLMVHNVSRQTVMGVVIVRAVENSHNTLTVYDDRDPLILPDALHYFPMNSQELTCPSPDKSSPDPVPCPIVLEGALFTDGSHAGNPLIVARLEASQVTTSGPRRQLRELLTRIVNDPGVPDAQKIEQLRTEIPKLPEQSDSEALDRIRPRYPELSDEDWNHIKKHMDDAVQRGHQRVLDSLSKFAQSFQEPGNSETLREWAHQSGLTD